MEFVEAFVVFRIDEWKGTDCCGNTMDEVDAVQKQVVVVKRVDGGAEFIVTH